MHKIHKSIIEGIGNTPLVEISRLNPNKKVKIFAKLESANPGGSIKDRTALYMIKNAEKVVDILHKKYLLGIVTSRIKETVYESPELAKLQKHFKVAVSYQDTINHKPHPEPLLLAVKKLEVRPEECVYVGDVENDIKAGKDAGMKTILYSKII